MTNTDGNSPPAAERNRDSLESYLETAEGKAPPIFVTTTDENGKVSKAIYSGEGVADLANFDPYDPKNLRIDQTNAIVAKKLLLTVKVKKPGKQEWFQVHPSSDYRVNVALLQEEGDSIEKEVFLVLPSARAFLHDNEYANTTLYLYLTSQGNPGIWPIRQPDGRKNDWQSTAAQAADLAMKGWVRIAANMAGKTNDVFEAVGAYPEPVWPEKSMRELLAIAFKDHVIVDGEHPMVRKLRSPVL